MQAKKVRLFTRQIFDLQSYSRYASNWKNWKSNIPIGITFFGLKCHQRPWEDATEAPFERFGQLSSEENHDNSWFAPNPGFCTELVDMALDVNMYGH
jgi:hypothetical protein